MTGAEYVEDICKRLTTAVCVPFRSVSIGGWEPVANRCHENVDIWVKAKLGATPVRGWIVDGSYGDAGVRLTAHSVVESADGDIFDITPMLEYRRPSMCFVRHVGDEAIFFAAKKISVFIDCLRADGAA